jgi:plastocyanin
MIDRKNLILITVVFILVLVLGGIVPYLQYKAIETSSTQIQTHVDQSNVIINYTNRGFEPATITVKNGTTLEWLNVSVKPMWVASDPHPAHTDLPGFDEKGISTDSKTYDFNLIPQAHAHGDSPIYHYTFTKVGEWKYHNHIVPADKGTVIVKE